MDPQNWRPDWIFAVTTLLIRFFGIFIVLAVLQIIMQISGYFFRRWAEKGVQETAETSPPSTMMESFSFAEVETISEKGISHGEIAAVIGAAISLYESHDTEDFTIPVSRKPLSKPSDWAMIGRMAQFQSRVFRKRD